MKFVFLSTAFLPNIYKSKINVFLPEYSLMKFFTFLQELERVFLHNMTRVNVLPVSEIVDSLTVRHLSFHRHYGDSSANETQC